MDAFSFTPFPVLNTAKYTLTHLTPEDTEAIHILRSDPQVLQYLGKEPETREQTEAFIEKIIDGISENKWIYWGIRAKKTNSFVGTICLWNFADDNTIADIGFELLPEYFGKGIMQEVIPAVLEYGFQTLQLKSIAGEVSPENIKSIKLMEKFGFSYYKALENTSVYILNNRA